MMNPQTLTHVGAIRRVQALGRIGYNAKRLSLETGICVYTLGMLASERSVSSSPKTRRRLAEAYSRLCMEPLNPRNTKAAAVIKYARQQHWQSPLAWDDIDDPEEIPQGTSKRGLARRYVNRAALERFMNGDRRIRLNNLEQAEYVRLMRAGGG